MAQLSVCSVVVCGEHVGRELHFNNADDLMFTKKNISMKLADVTDSSLAVTSLNNN